MDSAVVGLGETPKKRAVRPDDGNGNGAAGTCDSPRAKYLSWDDYFMSVACLSAQRSKDPSTQVGACIVNSALKIVGIGYNGMPTGCDDGALPWGKEAASRLDTKYPYVCHAEMNAIMNKNSAEVAGGTLYCNLFPCNECAKLIIQAGIGRVVFVRDKADKDEMKASKRMFDLVGIQYSVFRPTSKRILIDFDAPDGSCCSIVSD